ncbi:hypothetical protein GBAR_LOCUS22117 [Geodia barretti]|uniref:Death domain-containing protein n=1 Tax=Geodia barretti TaxID=519541 RepID=A0AA35X4S8_GEOBA|nr:hypothetical protein GBAR_LOCUS22117 [Geodia barretti]
MKHNGENLRLSMAILMPASNYTVYVHDLEKGGLPNIHPANLVPSSVEITRGEENYKAPNDENLNNASISRHGSILNVTCTPDEHSASCVLVFRARGNYMLNYEETFPVTVNLDLDVNYTFALFKRLNNDTDERPFLSMFVQGKEDPSQPPSSSTGTPERAETTSLVVPVTIGVLVAPIIILVVVAVSIIAIMLRKKKSRKSVEFVEYVDTKASNTALLMSRIADDGGMKNEESKEGEESKEEESKCAVVLTSVSVSRPYLPDVTQVQYREIDIRVTHKMARSAYTEMEPLSASRPKPSEMDTRTRCPYVTILPHATTPVNDNDNRELPTVAPVMSLLWGVAGRWKEIAEGLEFVEDLIDEIDDNNDMDEGCLQHCVDIWISKLQPSWEKLSHVLRDMGEVEPAHQALNKEPQEQWQAPSRQTSYSSSNAVVADASSQSTDFSGEMVPGVEKTQAPDGGNNEDQSREGKVCPRGLPTRLNSLLQQQFIK